METRFIAGLIAGAIGGTLISLMKLVIPINVRGQAEPLLLLVGRVFNAESLVPSLLILMLACTLAGIVYAVAFKPWTESLPNSKRIFNPFTSGIAFGALLW